MCEPATRQMRMSLTDHEGLLEHLWTPGVEPDAAPVWRPERVALRPVVRSVVVRGAPSRRPEYAIDAVDVVIKGAFNPAIFSPAWLLGQGLIGAAEYGDPEVQLITRDFASFRVGWLRCEVTPDACQLSTLELEEFERLRDVALGILRALPHTPISALGLNRQAHVVVPDVAAWHLIGDQLSPKEIWAGLLVAPGMRNVTVWGLRGDKYKGRVHVQVEPSFKVPQAVFMAVNDHYTLTYSDPEVQGDGERNEAWSLQDELAAEASSQKIPVAVEVLEQAWDASFGRASTYMTRVLEQIRA